MRYIDYMKYKSIYTEVKSMIEYFSYKTAMKYLGFESYKSLAKLIDAGLPVITVGKTKKISKTAIDKFMKEHETTVVSK